MFRSEYADVPPVNPPIHEAVPSRAAEFGDVPALIDGTPLSHEQVDRLVAQYDLTSLKYVISAAAPLDATLAEACSRRLNLPPLGQAYGMTELSPGTHVVPLDAMRDAPTAGDLSEGEVMMYVAERVAPYKRVRQVTFIDTVPRAASGKILRRELRERT
ncbi:MAG TPA: AMP-binding protein [Streptomyces sp.]|nr:AMP-binding protein [Streptomyces sp.]